MRNALASRPYAYYRRIMLRGQARQGELALQNDMASADARTSYAPAVASNVMASRKGAAAGVYYIDCIGERSER